MHAPQTYSFLPTYRQSTRIHFSPLAIHFKKQTVKLNLDRGPLTSISLTAQYSVPVLSQTVGSFLLYYVLSEHSHLFPDGCYKCICIADSCSSDHNGTPAQEWAPRLQLSKQPHTPLAAPTDTASVYWGVRPGCVHAGGRASIWQREMAKGRA